MSFAACLLTRARLTGGGAFFTVVCGLWDQREEGEAGARQVVGLEAHERPTTK